MSQVLSAAQQEDAVVKGGAEAAFDLGMAYSSGAGGMAVDLVQAHRWLNVAALCGYAPAQAWRAEIAAEMSAGDVISAQKLARSTMAALPASARRAA